ncbi:RNA polymerase sigma factor [Dictyobacter aurantiacus]|uniref:RNA polymerase subunit sigma-24 n=1 Tax=Dictyobacter aurantiacus TaxID=1936993 RepID=A0A401ZFS5_9CHLR|nr:sigma-70 family RNA polymerase sigma factor [Dictyobacter aurantiacus]GCE05538.1 RNA polymerase subunit sigma-24 [Dictyobacter aurantiacus]
MDTIPAAQAVETLIHEYYKLVFHTIYGLTNNWEESQDLTQDTFHQALKGIDAARASSGGHFHAKAWLLRIALNTVRMQRRRRALFSFIPFSSMHEKRQQEGSERNVARDEMVQAQAAPVQPGGYGTANNEDPAEAIAEQDAVQRTMALLPEPLRICLLFSIVGGLSTAEIADMLDLKEAAVRQRLVRARKQFQQLYSQQSGEELVDAAPPLATSSLLQQQSDGQDRKQRNAPKDTHRRLSLANQAPSIGSGYA